MKLRASRRIGLLALAAGFAHGQVFYVGDSGDGTIKRVDLAGNVTTYATGFSNIYGVAADGSGNVYVSSTSAHKVFVIDPSKNVTDYATNFPVNGNVLGMTFDAAGNLYVADVSAGVYKVLPGGSASLWATGISYPRDVAFNGSGVLFSAGGYNPMSMYSITSGGSATRFATVSAMAGFSSIGFDSAGNAYVSSAPSSTIYKVTSGGAVTTFLTGYSASALEVDGSDNIYFVAGSTMYVATSAGVVTTFATGFSNATSLTLAAPVPEPATVVGVLGLVAFAVVALCRRRVVRGGSG